ncbi:hypothetical protein SBA3_3980015 [Candidatus Sulfopaludibacter sp. SbA3]|nr:hypothetical protein SBA3_3980015 [Candidatus Sulfopaludibacter sp. SbA3]
MRQSLTRWDENGGENESGFRKGANSSQARRFAKRRRRHEDSPKDGEFRAWHGFAADTWLGIFEGGWHGFAVDTRLRIFEGGTVCGGLAAQDFRESRS